MNLDRYGDGCRCLLRLWENTGHPVQSDDSFIKQRLDSYPDWQERPGQADLARLLEIGAELGVGFDGKVETDYDRVLAGHELGHPILVRYTRAPMGGSKSGQEQTALLAEMTSTTMRVWVPEADGSSDFATFLRQDFWAGSGASAVILNASRDLVSSLR